MKNENNFTRGFIPAFLMIIIAGLLVAGGIWYYGSQKYPQLANNQPGPLNNVGQAPAPVATPPAADTLRVRTENNGSWKVYPVEAVSLLGYQFYTGKMDSTDSIAVGDQNKLAAANLLVTLGYPKSLTKYLAIVDGDIKTMKYGQWIEMPWVSGEYVAPLGLGTSEDQKFLGVYMNTDSYPDDNYVQGFPDSKNNGAVILLKNAFTDLANLTHELGHQIGHHMTDQEWAQYYKLRGIPSNTKRFTTNWFSSPGEDFAEVYKTTYAQGSSAEWLVRTLNNKQPDSATRQFIKNIVVRLNS